MTSALSPFYSLSLLVVVALALVVIVLLWASEEK